MKFNIPKYYFYYTLLIILVLVVIFAAINISVSIVGGSLIKNINDLTSADAILVPGASVTSTGLLSPVYKQRADKAVEIYLMGKATVILVSGDNGEVSYNEVTPAVSYLTKEKGIPTSDVFSDYAGFDTYSSVYRAKEIFQVRSLIVVSQAEYLPRALYLAKAVGIEVQGVSAGDEISFRGWFRERLASVKAFFDAVTHHESKFLGDKIPISGDGRESRGD